MKIAITTDTNSGITKEIAEELGVFVVPMPFYINDELFLEGITLSQEEFYKRLEKDEDIKTSMPAPGDVTDLWDELLKTYDEIIHIPMSSGLSGSCATAIMLAEDYGGKVQVADNKRISIIQYNSVLDAMELIKIGKNAVEIKEILEAHSSRASVYISLETLKYLKKGGRITPAAAAIGTILNIKPILQINGAKLDAYSKCRGKAQARKGMINAVKHDLENKFKENDAKHRLRFGIAYSGNPEEAEDWKKEVEEAFPSYPITMHPLSLSVACHIGLGALAITCSELLPESIIGH